MLNFAGILGNTYTILVMLFRKRLYNSCTPYLISVAISDLVVTSIILPVVGLNAVTGKVLVPKLLCEWFSWLLHNILGKLIIKKNQDIPQYSVIVWLITLSATSWLGLGIVSVVRCAGIWTNNECFLLKRTGTLITLTWSLPVLTNTYFVTNQWGSPFHINTGYVCWFFCGINQMIQVKSRFFKSLR